MLQPLAPATVRPSPIPLHAVVDARGARLHSNSAFVRVRAGMYARKADWTPLAPWKRYLARVHAFARGHPTAIFSHESAAALLGMPVFGEPRDIHLYDPGRARSRRFGDVCVHTSEDPRTVERREGIFMTSAVDTAVDLMRALPPALGLAVADAAVSPAQGGHATVLELMRTAGAQVNRRGVSRLALLLPIVDARSESPGESVSRAVIIWSGFEPPELQVVYRSEAHTDRADFDWPSVRALGESDGYEKYGAATTEVAVKQIIAEKRREDRLRRQCATFRRWDWAAAMAVAPLVERLVEMGIPRVASPRDALLATIGRNPRSLTPVRNHKRVETTRKG
ncbi:hypothetical protein [uncultured Microbacterium sp.]|uniref:hypothetical protein n=1 Tax=uncultured Microbacterium sp. TaxID=191216 RepID=UPI0035CAC079